MKKILVVCYSQSGQLRRIAQSFIAPLTKNAGVEIVWRDLHPVEPYPFPWSPKQFFDVFPESVCMIPPRLQPISLDSKARFDLIILAYQVWFLSPSLPMTAFLQSPEAAVLNDTPVITVVNCRDKWLMAQERVKQQIEKRGGRLLDNVVFVHQGNPLVHLITTLRWLWTGRKEGFWRIFPAAGVSERDIQQAGRFGIAIGEALARETSPLTEPICSGLGAVKVDANMVQQEKVAYKNFRFWATLIRATGKPGKWTRQPLLLLFVLYLSILILISLPLALVFQLLILPRKRRTYQQEVDYYEMPSGSSDERLPTYLRKLSIIQAGQPDLSMSQSQDVENEGENMVPQSKGTVLVTGASTGIGKATALLFDQQGYRVFAGVRTEESGQCLRMESSDRLTPILLDITDRKQIDQAVLEITAALEPAEGLKAVINNAGIVVGGPLECLDLDDFRLQLEVNVTGQLAVTQAFMPLIRRGLGRILFVGSVAGRFSLPFSGAYGASKFALEGLVDALRRELDPWHIPVILLEPGTVETPIWKKSLAAAAQRKTGYSEEAIALYDERGLAMEEIMKSGLRHSVTAKAVAKLIVKAIEAKRPRIRYQIGMDARMAVFSLLLPDRLKDWLMRKILAKELPTFMMGW